MEDFLPLQYTMNNSSETPITPGVGTSLSDSAAVDMHDGGIEGGPASFDEMLEAQITHSEISVTSPAPKPKRPFLKRGEGRRVSAKSPAKPHEKQQQRERKSPHALEERPANLEFSSSATVKPTIPEHESLNLPSHEVPIGAQFGDEHVALLEFEEFERSIEQNSAVQQEDSAALILRASSVSDSAAAIQSPQSLAAAVSFDDTSPWTPVPANPVSESKPDVPVSAPVSKLVADLFHSPASIKPSAHTHKAASPHRAQKCNAKCQAQKSADATRVEELTQQLAKVQGENDSMKLLRARHERELRSSRKDVERFEAHKQQEMENMKAQQLEEQAKFNKAKKQLYKQLRDNSNRDEQSRLQADLETARAELEQLQQSSIANEARLTMTVDRLKKRLTIQSKRIGELEEEVTLSESMRSTLGESQAGEIGNLEQRVMDAERRARDAHKKLEATEIMLKEAGTQNKALEASLMLSEPNIKQEVMSQHLAQYEICSEEDQSLSEEEEDGAQANHLDQIEMNMIDVTVDAASNDCFEDTQPMDCSFSPRLVSGEPTSLNSGKDVVKTQEYITQDGTKVALYSNGTRKETFCDGDSIIHFTNGDHKQMLSNGQVLYFYAETQTTHITHPDKTQVYQFPDGQVETQYPDGTQEIVFSDGTVKCVYKDGTEKIDFNDGTVQLKDAFGNERGLGSIT